MRLDADAGTEPDVLAPAHDLSVLDTGGFDAVFSSHCIEHLYIDQAVPALQEWRRVLREEGFLLLVCPDLQAAAEMIAKDQLFDIAYAGVTPYDIVFSHRGLVAQGRAQGHSFMEHKSGFTLSTLMAAVRQAGFGSFVGMRQPQRFELWLLASRSERPETEMRALARPHFLWPSASIARAH